MVRKLIASRRTSAEPIVHTIGSSVPKIEVRTETLEGNILLGVSLALSSSLTFAIYLLWNERRGLAILDSIIFVSLMSLFDTGDMFIYNLISDQLDIK